MTTSKRPPSGGKPSRDLYDTHDPIPQPDVVEGNTDTTWELWADVRDKEHVRYADTVSVTTPGALPNMPRPGAPLRPAPVAGASGYDRLLDECKRNNRVCPKPPQWQALDALLRAKAPALAASLPAPLEPREWSMTTSLAKRSMFRGLVDWAAANALTEDVLQFVRALPETQWHHLGD